MKPSKIARFSALAIGLAALLANSACQQRMAEQPAPRPYEQNSIFANKQSARPLEKGVIHRNQRIVNDDPLTTWLTAEGQKGSGDVKFSGDASYDVKSVVPPLGAPNDVKKFVSEFPFEITKADLERGQTQYNAKCALCHGAAGYANGKIVERGFLRPPSYHTDPAGKEIDAGHLTGEDGKKSLPAGYSRGFDRYGIRVALKDVPVGYMYQVITWGFGGMASHEVQLADPADRWRVVAYVRALQFSQSAPVADLPKEQKDQLATVGGKK